jgi:hypothetical protein
MSDNNVAESERRLQEIGNQLGTPILSPTTHIQVDDDNVRPSQSYEDLDGTIDSQPSSKNPLLQYIVAGAIGLGVVGVPLTVLFGLGGAPQTATTPTAPEVEDSTSTLADRELDNLKTQSALDIQAKPEAQTVTQTPKPAPTTEPVATAPATTPQTVAVKPQPKPKPVVKAPAPVAKPTTIAVQPPTVVAATPAPIAKPVPIPVAQPVARPIARPIPAPVIPQPRPVPIQVAATQPAQPVKPVVPEPPPLSVEQASALGMFGGDVDKPDTGAMALSQSNLSPTLTLPVGVNVAARTITPYTSLSSRNSATNSAETPLSVQLDQPIQLAQGFNLPAGTVVQFGATVNDNGAVTATSRGVFIDGTELKVPVGAFALTASNSTALVANQRSLREGELGGADTTAAIWGAAGALGKAFSDSGNTSVVNTSGLGTSVVQTNSGNVNIPGALLNGAFSPLAKAKESRANALATELQRSSKLNEIPVQSPVRVFVAAAATVQIPVASEVTATVPPEQGQSLGGGEVEQLPTMIPTQPISAANVPNPATVTSAPIAATTQTVATPPSPGTATAQPAFTPQLPITPAIQPATTPTIQATQGINTPSPIAPTKPNNVINTQPQAITPIQTTAPLPTIPNPTAATTQPSVVVQPSSNGAIAQPTTTPTTIEREARHQGGRAVTPQSIQQPATTSESTAVSPLVTTPPIIQSTATRSTFIAPQLPATTTQTINLPSSSPIAPTKPNNVVNTQPQSTLPQAIAPAPAVSRFTVTEDPQFELMPVQVDNTGNIQPGIAPTPRSE